MKKTETSVYFVCAMEMLSSRWDGCTPYARLFVNLKDPKLYDYYFNIQCNRRSRLFVRKLKSHYFVSLNDALMT